VLAELPDPDAVYVGGSGGALDAILEAVGRRARRSVVVALAGVERVAPALGRLRDAEFDTGALLLEAARLRPLGGEGDGSPAHRLAPVNPVFLVQAFRLPRREGSA
jgi:precorrin-6Y C5,15-methyltransferase (decarboxylating)